MMSSDPMARPGIEANLHSQIRIKVDRALMYKSVR